ncbi:NUDIX domain-containing protein [Actinocorallia populi]|uniref:NUDIX domain-containing protein n=1 Tax=Actinocorallia populi TaxID=2079200 RepID=UPI0013007206|nr:NUDIX hydrolase [Actinocorallia populi]
MNFPRGVEVIVSALIVSPEDEVLLIRQPKWGDLWTPPGGHVEPGETLAEAALREAVEETGLEVALERLVHWGELIDPDGRSRPVHFVFFDFAFRARGRELTPDPSEISEARWVPFGELSRYEIVPDFRVSIEKYLGALTG